MSGLEIRHHGHGAAFVSQLKCSLSVYVLFTLELQADIASDCNYTLDRFDVVVERRLMEHASALAVFPIHIHSAALQDVQNLNSLALHGAVKGCSSVVIGLMDCMRR